MMRVWRLSIVYIEPKSTKVRPRKTKIGTDPRDSDTTFKVKRSKVNLQGRGHVVTASLTAYAPPPNRRGIKRCFVWRLSVEYIRRNSRTERPRKTKIGTGVAHVTRTPFSRSRSPDCFTHRVLTVVKVVLWSREGGGSPDKARLEQTLYPFQPH